VANEVDACASSVARRFRKLAQGALGQTRTRPHSERRRHRNRVHGMRVALRIASNIGLILGQIVLLFVSRDIGLAVIICSSLLSVPFFLKERMIDVITLIAFMQVINIIGLFFR
jgi:hypothetical protein